MFAIRPKREMGFTTLYVILKFNKWIHVSFFVPSPYHLNSIVFLWRSLSKRMFPVYWLLVDLLLRITWGWRDKYLLEATGVVCTCGMAPAFCWLSVCLLQDSSSFLSAMGMFHLRPSYYSEYPEEHELGNVFMSDGTLEGWITVIFRQTLISVIESAAAVLCVSI